MKTASKTLLIIYAILHFLSAIPFMIFGTILFLLLPISIPLLVLGLLNIASGVLAIVAISHKSRVPFVLVLVSACLLDGPDIIGIAGAICGLAYMDKKDELKKQVAAKKVAANPGQPSAQAKPAAQPVKQIPAAKPQPAKTVVVKKVVKK